MNQHQFSTYCKRFYKSISVHLLLNFFTLSGAGCLPGILNGPPQEPPEEELQASEANDQPQEGADVPDRLEKGNPDQAAIDDRDDDTDSVTNDANHTNDVLKETDGDDEDDDDKGVC